MRQQACLLASPLAGWMTPTGSTMTDQYLALVPACQMADGTPAPCLPTTNLLFSGSQGRQSGGER